jgi:hypothetical protein
MSIYYKFKGSLTFENEEEAANHFQTLLGDKKGIFWLPKEYLPSKEIFLEGNKIRIDGEGFCGGESYYDTQDLIKESARSAKKGKVKCYEGDDENDGSYEYISV